MKRENTQMISLAISMHKRVWRTPSFYTVYVEMNETFNPKLTSSNKLGE